ncbi:MAG: transporter substrate-binding domain-containing protein [Deltaproteobacteria bacterium]|nr:transporter substrate-binding domain-containing protein [Deltaproteobacteria bacterium]
MPFGAMAAPPIRSASEIDYPPFCMVDAKGRVDGFSVELMRAALAAMDREVTFRTGTWAEVRGWLEQGEVQALPLVGRTPERDPIFDFTFPYMSLHGAIVVREKNKEIHDMGDLRGRQVAVMKGDNAEEFLRREKRGIEIRTTTTFEEALRQLSEDQYDAVVIQRLVALRLIQGTGLTNLRVIDRPIEGFRQDFCFAVREGDRETLALLNEGLSIVMADGTYRHLHAKWFAALQLPTDRPIVVGGDHNYPPFEYLDENGRPAGYNVALTRAIALEMGLDVEIRLGPWAEIVQGMEEGKIDVMQGMFYLPERDLKFDFTQPHMVSHYVSVVRRGEGDPPATFADLASKRIVVQRGDAAHDFLVAKGMGGQVSLAETQEDVLRELAEGKHDCALAVRISSLYLIEERGWKNLVLGRQAFLPLEYCYAAPSGHKAILAQFSEGLKILDTSGEYRRIYEKWLGSYKEGPPSLMNALRYSAMVLLPLIVILLAVFLWLWTLRRQVATKTRELKESVEFQRAMIACSPVALYSIGLEGNVQAWNESAEKIFGWSAGEVMGKPLPIVPQDMQDEFSALRKRIMEDGGVSGVEVVRQRKDGSLFDASLSAAPIYNARGDVIGIMSSMEDITQRKRTEAALQKSEIQYRSLFDHSLDAFLLTAPDGSILDVNPAACEMFGRTAEEIKKLGRNALVDVSDPRLQKRLEERAKTGKVQGEITLIRADNTRFPAEITSTIYTDENGLQRSSMIIRDITERKQAEAVLRERDEGFKKLSAHIPGMIYQFMRRPDGTYCLPFTTEAIKDIFGCSPEDVKEDFSPIIRVIFPEDLGRVTDSIELSAKRMTTWQCEYRVQIPGRPVKWLHGESSPEKLADGSILWHGFNTDITERRRAEEEREKLQAQLNQAQKMESVGRLAGGVAHDFNNKLSVILGYTELAMEGLDKTDSLYGKLQEVMKAGKQSIDIVRQLLAFARKQTIAPKALDLNETVEGMLKMLRRLIGEDIDLSWEPDTNLWPVKMDPAQIDQILANLCVNARDAISGVGKITIETENVVLDKNYCADRPEFAPGDYVMLAVSDNGSGMDKETLTNAFEPFFTTKEVGKGTGLGLSTVYGIVKQNQGFVNVYSEPGKGTSIKIYLPRHLGAAEEVIEAARTEVPQGRGETILIVEDEASVLRLAQRLLENMGYRVLTSATPSGALTIARDHTGEIHLLMTDVVLPKMSGKDLAAEIMQIRPNIGVLFMSGYTANVIAHQGVLDEGVHFIEKPFTQEGLARKVREAMGTRNAEVGTRS